MDYWQIRKYSELKELCGKELLYEPDPQPPGMRVIQVKNWRLVEPLLYTMLDMSHAIYRGVPDSSFSLTPSMFRTCAFKSKKTIGKKNEYIESCYQHFLEGIRGNRGSLSKSLDSYSAYELWSLGRHFGVASTLLDWSHSPYIGLFFAFANWEDSGTRSLYCLKRNIIQTAQEESRDSSKDAVRGRTATRAEDVASPRPLLLSNNPRLGNVSFYKPFSADNYRMIHQQGLFTVSRSPHSLEKWVSKNFNSIHNVVRGRLRREKDVQRRNRMRVELGSKWILLKINIETNDNGDRPRILKYLNRMNINHATLFPDVEGASLYANMQGSIPHY